MLLGMKGFVDLLEAWFAAMGLGEPWAGMATTTVMVVVSALLAWAAYAVCRRVLVPLAVKFASHTDIEWDDLLFNDHSLRAACRIVPAVVVWQLLPAVFWRTPIVQDITARATAIYITVMAMLLGLSLIDAFKSYEYRRHAALQQYYHTFCGVLKILIAFVSVIVMVAIAIDRNPLTIIAGLGATSAILMLVFKDTIAGLVAGVRLTSNDMLHRDDWITVPQADINGIVEDITLTTVKVRNFDNTILTITPQALVDGTFQNWRGMRQGEGRRVKRLVYFDFRCIRHADDGMRAVLKAKYGFKEADMPPGVVNMALFRRYVEAMLAARPEVNTDMLFMVRQLEATSTGLPLEFYFFLRQKEWKPYEHLLAEIMEQIYAVIPDFGLRVYQRFSDGGRTDGNCPSEGVGL